MNDRVELKNELIKLVEEMDEYQEMVFGKFREFEERCYPCKITTIPEYIKFRRQYNFQRFEDSIQQIFEYLEDMEKFIIEEF